MTNKIKIIYERRVHGILNTWYFFFSTNINVKYNGIHCTTGRFSSIAIWMDSNIRTSGRKTRNI